MISVIITVSAHAQTPIPAATPWIQDWPDHRPLGALMLCQSPSTPKNPNGYCNDASIDVATHAGRQRLKDDLTSLFQASVYNLRSINGQGIVIWDVTGDSAAVQSYVGDPRLMPYLSPLVNGYIDALVKTVTQAGLRIGFCVRDCFYQLNTATAKWVPAPYTDERTRYYDLGSKIAYAHNRWGATLIYIDSYSGTAATLENLAQDFPDILLMPEQAYPARWTYEYAAPFEMVNLYRDQTRWDDRQAIPTARQVSYAANQPFDGSQRAGEIEKGILHGDILMVRSWWTGGSDWQFARDLISKGAW